MRSLQHVLDDAGKTIDCLRHVLFDVVADTVFSTFSLVLERSRTISSMSAVIPGSGRARDSLHFQHVNSDAKRVGDSFQQHHGYRIPWIASTPLLCRYWAPATTSHPIRAGAPKRHQTTCPDPVLLFHYRVDLSRQELHGYP